MRDSVRGLYHVEVQDASVRQPRGSGLAGLSFTARPGESVAILGGLDSRKELALQLLAGRLKPESGYVHVLGKTPHAGMRRVGYTPERPRFTALLSPNRLLALEAARHGVPVGQRPARVAEVIDLLDLYGQRDRPIRELGPGERAAVTLAAALVHRPMVLLLDNPLTSLPDRTATRLWHYLEQRQAKEGASVVFTTVRSAEAERADHVALLDGGRMLACGRPGDLLQGLEADTVIVEAAEPEAVQRNLRGIYDVELIQTRDGVLFQAADGTAVAAHLLRHPVEGARAIYLRPPTLWDALQALSKHR